MAELRLRCCIEGCDHTTAQKGADRLGAQWICAGHWRLIPPPARRVWHRACPQARDERRICARGRGDRLWAMLRRLATARAAGDIDQGEIHEMFGLGEAA